jgi:sulfite exporter TauE/SafE
VIAAALSGYEVVGVLVGLAIVTAALVIAARLKPPSMVVMAVSLLTLALLAAWVADPNRADNLVPLIGVGLGALAGALSNIFDKREPPLPPDSSPEA